MNKRACSFEDYILDVKSQLICNASEEYKSKYITSLLYRSICWFINCFNPVLDTVR